MNKSTQQYTIKNTLGMFDFIKGLIMIIVMVSHTYGLYESIDYNNKPLLVIFAFLELFGEVAMPVLFILSGYGFRKTTFSKSVKKQCKTLLFPYVITMFIACIAHLIAVFLLYGGARYSITQTARVAAGAVLGLIDDTTYFGIELKKCGPAWFLLALALGNIIFNQLLQHFKGKKLLVISALIACIGWALTRGPIIPWAIPQAMIATFYLCIGYMAKKSKLFMQEMPKVKRNAIMIALFILTIAVINMGGGFNMALNMYAFGPVSIIVMGGFSLVVIYLFLNLNRFKNKFVDFNRRIGRQSLYVLCAHTIEIVAAGFYIQYDFAMSWTGNLMARSLIIIVVRIVVVLVATFVFVRLKKYFLRNR